MFTNFQNTLAFCGTLPLLARRGFDFCSHKHNRYTIDYHAYPGRALLVYVSKIKPL